MEALIILTVFAAASIIAGSAIGWFLFRDTTDYAGMARSLRRMRDENAARGQDFKTEADLAKIMLGK